MKLSRFYSNQPELFEPVEFKTGLNVIMAEIRLPENLNRDTHNLGKTTLGRLLDFAFLSKRKADFFLFRHLTNFKNFVFFLEIELADCSYLTVRRSVQDASKISFKKHSINCQDFTFLPAESWDHVDMPFEAARSMLDGMLDWRGLKPYSYRKILGYLIRSQNDYQEVFKLKKFSSKDSDWKSFLAHELGFNSKLVTSLYEMEDSLKKKKSMESTIKNELGGSIEDISKIEGLLLLKHQEVEKKQNLHDVFDFRFQDKNNIKQLVDEIDQSIADLNDEYYYLSKNKKKITSSIQEDQILFKPEEAQQLFEEAGVQFPGQIKRDFEQLISFNRAITDERRGYLQDELREIETKLKQVTFQLNTLGKQRSEKLSFLNSSDAFTKFKLMSNDLINLRADITSLERQREFLYQLQELRKNIRTITEGCIHLQSQIEADVEQQNADKNSLFSSIRLFFNEIVEEVISRKALLSVSPNKLGHLEFKAEILDDSGKATSADRGYTYKKLLCIAFDMALIRAHANDQFPRFVYHDGVFESLDDRKKENLLGVIRNYAKFGIQPIITLISSDLPSREATPESLFDKNEIVLLLHDENEQGRLFKMKTW